LFYTSLGFILFKLKNRTAEAAFCYDENKNAFYQPVEQNTDSIPHLPQGINQKADK
jgi:hypothetical protein